MTRDFVPGCFNRYIFVLAEIDSRITRAEQFLLQTLVPLHRYRPIVFVVPSIVPSTTATAAIVPLVIRRVVPATGIARLFGRLLPSVVARQIALLVLTATAAGAASVTAPRIVIVAAILEVVATISRIEAGEIA